MKPRMRSGKLALLTIVGVLGLASMAPSALASGGFIIFADHYGPLYSGSSYENLCVGCWHASNDGIDGQSTGTAYSGVWFANSSGTRVSADTYCSSPGCHATHSWFGPYPSGFGVIHNHGNASPSYFNGGADYL
jgi:hypothetical protein